jgi:hypothetical protein
MTVAPDTGSLPAFLTTPTMVPKLGLATSAKGVVPSAAWIDGSKRPDARAEASNPLSVRFNLILYPFRI